MARVVFFAGIVAIGLVATPAAAQKTVPAGPLWPLHVIDDSSRGADGVKLADVNNDGLPDITNLSAMWDVVRRTKDFDLDIFNFIRENIGLLMSVRSESLLQQV